MMKLKRACAIALLLTCNTGCNSTRYIIKSEQYDFQKTKAPDTVKVRIHKEDSEIAKEQNRILRSQIDFHNQQIDDYQESFQDTKNP